MPLITSHSSQDDDAYRTPAERAEADRTTRFPAYAPTSWSTACWGPPRADSLATETRVEDAGRPPRRRSRTLPGAPAGSSRAIHPTLSSPT